MKRTYFIKILWLILGSFIVFWVGQGVAHIPLIISRSSDSACIAILAECRLHRDIVLVNIGSWFIYVSLLLFILGLVILLILSAIWLALKVSR